MSKKILYLAPVVVLLGACSASCSDRFAEANDHVLDTAQIVYESRMSGNITADAAYGYQDRLENAYGLIGEGSALCDSDEAAAEETFEEAEGLLDAVEDEIEAFESKGE